MTEAVSREHFHLLCTIHDRVTGVLFNAIDPSTYRQNVITDQIRSSLKAQNVPLDDLSEKILAISELLLDYYHHFVILGRQTREKNQLFINDILQQLNREVLKHLVRRGHPMARVFPRASHWLGFAMLPPYTHNLQLFERRLPALAEYSATGSAILLMVMASRVRQGNHHTRYLEYLETCVPLLTTNMILELDKLFRNQNHHKAKRMAFALINGLMVPARAGTSHSHSLEKWERYWHREGIHPKKIIKEIFQRFPEFIHAERLQSRFGVGYPAGEDIPFIAKLATSGMSLYKVLTDAHDIRSKKVAPLLKTPGWVVVPFEIDQLKRYVEYERVEGHQLLFTIWSLGRSSDNELILQARRMGFRGHLIKHGKQIPFAGYEDVCISPPAAFDYLKTLFIYQMGAYENLIQHAGGNGVYLWRETPLGYEFIMFDHGRGVRDVGESSISLDRLRSIFDYGVTFRKGKRGPGRTHKASGLGQSFFYLANETYLTRLISVTKDRMIRVVEKAFPGKDQGETIATVGAEYSFDELGFDYRYATGVIIQGFVPFDQGYRTVEYTPIHPETILGMVVPSRGTVKTRGKWQEPPDNRTLDQLLIGDTIEFSRYQAEERETVSTMTRIVSHVPTEESPLFVFDDGSSLSLNGLLALEHYGKRVELAECGNPLETILGLGIFSLDEVTLFTRNKEVKETRTRHTAVVTDLPSPKNQGTFSLRTGKGSTIVLGPEQIFEVVRRKSNVRSSGG